MGNLSIKGHFIETDIFFQGIKQPPRQTCIISIENDLNLNFDELKDEDEVHVLSVEGNWYTLKKKDVTIY